MNYENVGTLWEYNLYKKVNHRTGFTDYNTEIDSSRVPLQELYFSLMAKIICYGRKCIHVNIVCEMHS